MSVYSILFLVPDIVSGNNVTQYWRLKIGQKKRQKIKLGLGYRQGKMKNTSLKVICVGHKSGFEYSENHM